MEYNENDAIKHIRSKFDGGLQQVSDDELLNILDMIFDYYEENGLLDISTDPDDDVLDGDALVAYVRKMMAKDRHSTVNLDDVETIVIAAVEYEESLDEL